MSTSTIQVPTSALTKVADTIDALVALVEEQDAELTAAKKAASSAPAQPRVVELLKVASDEQIGRLERAMIRGGVTKEAAAAICKDFRQNPDKLAAFTVDLLDQASSRSPADGHGVPKSASENSASDGAPKKSPYDS